MVGKTVAGSWASTRFVRRQTRRPPRGTYGKGTWQPRGLRWNGGLGRLDKKGPGMSITCIFCGRGELDLDFLPPLYQSPLQASTNRTALRSSWGSIYVRTSCLISAFYEILSDFEKRFFFWPLGAWWGWDAVVYIIRRMTRYYFNIVISNDRVYCITSILGNQTLSGSIPFCSSCRKNKGSRPNYLYINKSKLALRCTDTVVIVIDNRECVECRVQSTDSDSVTRVV